MIGNSKVLSACALAAMMLSLALPVSAVEISGRVVGVADGDTLTVLDSANQQHRVRLAQIDAPEKNQAFGQRSKQALSDLCFGKPAVVQVATHDRYGRAVGQVSCAGHDANLEQVTAGLAWAYRQYKPSAAILQAEQAARESRRGLWQDANPAPPWDFRHGKAGATIAAGPAPAGQVRTPDGTKASAGAGMTCGSKQYCKDMSSCAEARFYLTNCGVTSLDRDHDGVPCENICPGG
jgi:endonuclease YncB( thermonuclease family)